MENRAGDLVKRLREKLGDYFDVQICSVCEDVVKVGPESPCHGAVLMSVGRYDPLQKKKGKRKKKS